MPLRFSSRHLGIAIAVCLALAALAGWLIVHSFMDREPQPHLPERFAADLPTDCRQLMLVVSPHQSSVPARLWLMHRGSARDSWQVHRGPIEVTLGRNGLAWGTGEHRSAPPEGFPIKFEGDGCSPAGIFRIPFAFGLAEPEEAAHLRLPYTFLTPDIFGVEDPGSRYYNQVVDVTKVERDWSDEEHDPMSRRTSLYRWGAFVAHNPERTPGAGSCIFLHRWPGPGEPTAGCTGMAEQDLAEVLSWLDPALEPRLVQGIEDW
jgi:L,D-peptidoglycan transpeptidase YkuD (ErfK/YbiS/YcfS/YnhG family)